ncbi:efflux RND transporter permease subunit [Neorhizobium galegae]|uniref:efflux RND transporter permease subunit n=1 Tax=Neorhizobium galegae TaxID=399 RepID=UPI0012727167|nr:efflux RND transporter permease subunit [Neorhizobium galegae]KAA9383391.1 efflux RND transporter permease subunit [Neorhizobium galegae]MCM2500262.1 efflux RND transporter permease subunit [Neorhizobium galegae]MCQ1770793.1 efflux RND transporter permease subunit [Neorhizobium galegae]
MNISAWAIRNPLPSILLFLILVAAGLYSFSRLPVTYFPTIDEPAVNVTIDQPGGAPSELETGVTRLVEDAVASLAGVEEIKSTVTQGRSVTAVEFELGVISPDRAMGDVRDAVAKIRSDLPDGIDEPVIERAEEEAQAVVTYAVTSQDMTVAELSWFVDDVVARQLQGLKGVGRIDRVGGADREIHVALDPSRLQALSLTANAVNESLIESQLDRSGGRSNLNGRERALTTAAAARTIAELGDARILLSDDASVKLDDVGSVQDTIAEARTFATLDQEEVVGFAVYRSKGASELVVAEEVAAALEKLNLEQPSTSFKLVDDNMSYTAGNYNSAMHTLYEGAALSIVVVFLFLRDWRGTIVAAIALPLSIIPTFFAIDLLGFSLNILSLLGITLVTGILVDDAIVEIENVVRHRDMGKSAYRAALDASDEIGLAVMAISATIMAVFTPVGFMSGVVGLYFREFGLTVAIAVFFSLLAARLITPIMAAYIMTNAPPSDVRRGRLVSAYGRLLKVSLRWRWMTVGCAFAAFALALYGLISLPTAFLPEEDTGRLTLSVELPPGAALHETRTATDEIASVIRRDSAVEGVFVRAGSSTAGQEDIRYATVLIDLFHKSERDRSSFSIQTDLEKALFSISDVRLRFLNTRGGRDISFAVLSADGAMAQRAADNILHELTADRNFVNPSADNVATRPELRVKVDPDKASTIGVSAAELARTIRVSTVGDVDSRLPNFLDGGRQIPIRVLLQAHARDDLPTLEMLSVPTTKGTSVPLSSVAEISFDERVAAIERFDRQRRIEISADMAEGMTSGQGLDRLTQLDSVKNLPAGVRIQATGDSDTEGEVFSSFVVAMGSGVMLVLVVLILLFGSVLAPWTILASLPLSIGGVATGLMLSGHAVSLPVVIGILMLMGIVTKNAIMLLDFAIEREAHGMPRVDAIIEACLERVRPIIMTTFAMIGGMAPSALGVGDGGEFRAPMAIAVIGGLLVSTVLSLLVIPSLHLIVSDLGDRTARIFKPFLQSAEI